jgi:hypothetical protein
MPLAVLDLDTGVLDYDRAKTGAGRMVTLWPRTAEALRGAILLRPNAEARYEAHVFLTRCGVPFCRSQKTGDGAPTQSDRADARRRVHVLVRRS